ncbi:Uracil DNA glycosylase superfamily protein [Enhygromyxa salina]|uniref:Uracil DNA glycosylase superfamily protein n=1 Tax=Enhygromyxa salina TaxID=215803 RepID=A0A2S9XRN3_9BACT|nr:uracil-DNA glycosylase family protein [Enhygromyxa salina]PRP95522.1 Uracil DNA glycosylase superfamily protein [Enhygromyxa salina]
MAQALRLLEEIRACTACAAALPHDPRPVVSFGTTARVAIIGQAPGARVHASGVPWADPSGDTLRAWMDIDHATFYDPNIVAIVPMGFCYPGAGKSGDLPPRPECAPLWHEQIFNHLDVQLTLLIGRYAQARYLGQRQGKNLTETVRQWRRYGTSILPLPHPSPRNRRWFARNLWFADEVLPVLKRRLRRLAVR